MPEGRYSAADIQVLEGLEAIRVRPRRYVGDTASDETVNGLVLEALCLAVDVRTGGPARNVTIELLSDDVAEVRNDGPGLPLGRHRTEDVSFVELIMTRLYACRDAKADEVNARWCNLGIAVVNAFSAWCVVTVRRDGGLWQQRFEKGKAVQPFSRLEDCADTGTTLKFCLDRELVTGKFDVTRLEAALERFAAEVPCTTVSLHDVRAAAQDRV